MFFSPKKCKKMGKWTNLGLKFVLCKIGYHSDQDADPNGPNLGPITDKFDPKQRKKAKNKFKSPPNVKNGFEAFLMLLENYYMMGGCFNALCFNLS